ncbi:hypothetical protein [Treponema sp.]|uniref:hypothetical protein n=1 Tax=Treponema sp. TaxID=166 RepID=UPI00298DA2C1|nr:hypothetical protein [Treponema sp.]MCQ2242310.1 hypothetical protein [Treponema sp.]
MNRRLLYILISIFLLIFSPLALVAQVQEQSEQLRILVWADLDAFPGKFEETEEAEVKLEKDESKDQFHRMFDFAIERSKQVAPFLLNGMINGWKFEYTPYDKRRGVKEYWEFDEIKPFDKTMNPIEFHDPEAVEGKLLSRVYCNRTKQQQLEYKRWCSIVHPHIKGIGRGSVEKGFDGIKEACSMALKDAVREYWRTLEKNKPKEISGTVLLIRDPRIYVRNGQYVVDLDFFLETDRIIKYTQF